MKILHVVSMLTHGGTGEALVNMISAMRTSHPEVENEIAAPASSTRASEVRSSITVHSPLSPDALVELVQNGKYDVIHWWRTTYLPQFEHLVKKLGGSRPPIVLTLCQVPVNFRYGLRMIEAECADRIVLICRSADVHPSLRWLPENDRRMIYFGTDWSKFKEDISSGRKENGFIFGRGSALNKCPSDTIANFAGLLIPGSKYLIAGDDDDSHYRHALTREIDRRGLRDRVKLVGQLNRKDWVAFLRSLDVFLYQIPKNSYSAVDGVVQDAMMCELPIVLMGGSGPKELIEHGKSGFIANNRQELTRYCMELYQDANLRKAMGKEARMRILSHFDLKQTVEKYVQLYMDVRIRARVLNGGVRARHIVQREKLKHCFRFISYLLEWSWRKVVTKQSLCRNCVQRGRY